jgi:pimeloyl-ACP methyl ester carboxylesterase
MPKWLRNILIVLGAVFAALAAVVFVVSRPLPAEAKALAALNSSASVTVENTSSSIVFKPTMPFVEGFIFYPGARVAPEAYAVPMRAIAEAGYLVYITKMPLNFAVFNVNAAESIISSNPNINWAIGGHSLGGAMACSYAKNKGNITKLIFWAAYCDKSFDFSSSQIPVTSIYGSEDGLATPEKVAATKIFAPSSTKYVEIKGMNHAQFGDYGEQSGDKSATISAEEANKAIVEATLAALK